jgi:hypothetical protein
MVKKKGNYWGKSKNQVEEKPFEPIRTYTENDKTVTVYPAGYALSAESSAGGDFWDD